MKRHLPFITYIILTINTLLAILWAFGICLHGVDLFLTIWSNFELAICTIMIGLGLSIYALIQKSNPLFRKVTFIWNGLLIVLLLLFVISTIFLCGYSDDKYRKQGQVLIDRVESFRLQHGHLPVNDWPDLNWEEMGVGPYYEKKTDSTYIVFFCTGFDDYYIYDSETKKWHAKPYLK